MMMLPCPVNIPVLVVYLMIALVIFSVLPVHHVKPVIPFSAGRVGKKQHRLVLCRVKMD